MPHHHRHRLTGLCRLLALILLLGAFTAHAQGDDDAAPEDGANATASAEHNAPAPSAYAKLVASLAEANYPEKRDIVSQLAANPQEHTAELLRAFADRKLVARESDGQVFVVASEDDDVYSLRDPITFEDAGTANSDDFDDIRTNITLRRSIDGALAQLKLNAPDAETRLEVVNQLTENLNDSSVAALRAQRPRETDDDVKAAIDRALAIADINASDPQRQLEAIEAISGDNSNAVYNRLKSLLLTIPADSDDAAKAQVRAAAAAEVERIDWWRSFYDVLDTLFFGLSLGSILVLAAIGLAITFGVMGVINMAHGELIMLGAYTTFVMQQLLPNHIGLALVLAVPAAFVVSGLVGILIERTIVQFLYGRPLETLLATFGVSLFLQQLVRTVFTPLNRSVASPEWMSGLIQFNDMFALTANRLVIVAFTAVVFIALMLVMQRTSLGLKVRAVSQNRSMARAMGIRTQRVDALTFGLGAGVAGIAGVALSQLTNVGPNLGQSYIIDSFMVVVFGGVGNLWGTLVGGLTLGVLTKFLEPWSGAVLAKILVLVFLILFIQRRPRGLFPQRGRAAEGT